MHVMPTPNLVLKTAPTTRPVTTAEAKAWARIDTTDDDTLVGSLIEAATAYCETFTNRQFMTATWDQIYDTFPQFIRIRKPPLASSTSIIYLDSAGSSQTLATNQYQVITSSLPGHVYRAPSVSWPSTESGRFDAVTVKFVAGYGDASAVPEGIKDAIKQYVTTRYNHREEIIVGQLVSEMKGMNTVRDMLKRFVSPEVR